MQAENPIRILILDYHLLTRESLTMLLDRQPGFQVVGSEGTWAGALALIAETCPDIILLELNLDGELDAEIIPQLIEIANGGRVIVVTSIEEPNIHQLAVQMGAMGIIHKIQSASILIKAIEKVHAGEVWIDRSMMASVLSKLSNTSVRDEVDEDALNIASLSNREREVITLIGEGLKNKQIAIRLSISETTVRHHLTSVYRKLDLSDRLELAIFAYRNALADPPM
ncbi:LuxR C-terminal-related transcriptional regulator [Chloroflexota bacterium]